MAETLADYFKSGQLWVKSYQRNYDLQKFVRVDFTPDVFEKGSQIEQLIHKFFNTPMTGLKPVRNLFWKGKNYIAFEETQTVYNFAISISNYLDNYFIINVRHPAVGEAKYNNEDPNQIHITEDLYIIDGLDGLEDWITHHQINKDNVEFFDIIHFGLPEEDSMKLKLTNAYQNVLKMNKIYPHISVSISDSGKLIRFYQKVIYFQKDASGKYTFYGLFDKHENFYIYRTPEQVKREKFWKEEYDRLYGIWYDYRDRKEINLTKEEESYLRDYLRNPSWSGHVSDTNANFANEETYQKCLELVNKLQDTAKKEGKNFKYLMRYKSIMRHVKLFKDYQFITEKLTDVDDDVDLIYDLFFKKDIEEIGKTGIATKSMFKESESDTSILKSAEATKGHQIAPCNIIINGGLNGYNPIDKTIYVSVSLQALGFAFEDGGDIMKAAEWMDEKKNSFLKEFTKEKIKGSIHHELVHWLDDIFHSGHIKKRIENQLSAGTRNLGGKSVNAEKFEIQGQIHNIKQLYNSYKNDWDMMTFNQMLSFSPPLSSIYRSLSGEEKKQWKRDLKTRMSREGLLGSKMRD